MFQNTGPPLISETFCIAHFAGPTEVMALEDVTIPTRKVGYGNGSAGSSRAGAPKPWSQGTYSICQLACKYQWSWVWPPHPPAPNFQGGGYYRREQDRQLPGDHGGPVIPHSAWNGDYSWKFTSPHSGGATEDPDSILSLDAVCVKFVLSPSDRMDFHQHFKYLDICVILPLNCPSWVCRI